MIVRLTFIGFQPQNIAQAKKLYNEQIVPVIRKQKGNLDCRLLEPVVETDDYISMTTWASQEDADAYHQSGVYRELVEKVSKDYAKAPVLKVYTTESIMETAL